jgi:hypothetical protein
MIRDWRGTEIEVGDTILYSVKESTSVEVHEAIVREIGEKPIYVWPELNLTGPIRPYAKVEWLRSCGGEWAEKWRRIRKVTLHTLYTVTVIRKARKADVPF